MALQVSSRDTAMLLRLGIDPTKVVQGQQVASASLRKLDTSARATATAAQPLNDKMFTMGSSMVQVAGASSTLGPHMMLVVNAMKLVDDAARGVITSMGTLAIAAIPALLVVGIQLIKWLDDGKDAANEFGESITGLIGELDALGKLQRTAGQIFAEAGEKVLYLQDMVAGYDAAIKMTAATILSGTMFDMASATAALIALKRQKGEAEGQLAGLEAAIAGYHERMAANAAAAWQVIDFTSVIPESLPDMDLGKAVADITGEQFKREAPEALALPPVVGQKMASTLTNSLMQVWQQGEEGFENMIKQWFTMLASSAVLSLILSIFNPGKSFGSFFGSMFGFQHGTPYVPRTGLAVLHKGEAVIPASQNMYSTVSNTMQGADLSQNNTFIIQRADARELARELEDMARNRQAAFVLR